MGAPEALAAVESVPHAAAVQPLPESVQMTPLFWESFWTVDVKDCDCLMGTVAVGGVRATVTGEAGLAIFTVALAEAVESVMEVAIRVTVGESGGWAGAV
jgi:hypothetical protein